jgi:hypothetical protein
MWVILQMANPRTLPGFFAAPEADTQAEPQAEPEDEPEDEFVGWVIDVRDRLTDAEPYETPQELYDRLDDVYCLTTYHYQQDRGVQDPMLHQVAELASSVELDDGRDELFQCIQSVLNTISHVNA